MRPCQLRSTGLELRPECHRQTGRLGRRTPEYHNASTVTAELVLISGSAGGGRTVFPPPASIYRAVDRARQGRPCRGIRDLNRMLNDIYNKRIIELAGNIP